MVLCGAQPDVFYEIHGSGPRVVLISGTGADLRQNPRRDRDLLAQHHEVLMYDQRGLGRSGKPDRPYSMVDYADDPLSAMGARRQLEARAEHDVWDSLGAITAPTFVIGGQYDMQAPPDNVERLASRIPDATLRVFDGGHLFLLQDPTAWPAVVDFLAA
ncbi:MAG: alpha/beta fold hydrolase [Acidimicrobiales bacterium]